MTHNDRWSNKFQGKPVNRINQDSQENFEGNMPVFVIITASADGLALLGARTHGSTVMTTCTSSIYLKHLIWEVPKYPGVPNSQTRLTNNAVKKIPGVILFAALEIV